jgi:peptide/nickel transport system permease protein
MNFKPVILPTDLLFFILLLTIIVSVFYIKRYEHLREPWRQIISSPAGMVSSMILLAYLSIAILDSLHFRPMTDNPETNRISYTIKSVLDTLMSPLDELNEKTYSAPFATHLFVKENMMLPDHHVQYGYPRLLYAGKNLGDRLDTKWQNITDIAIKSLVRGLVIWLLLTMTLIYWLARKNKISSYRMLIKMATGKTMIPWRMGLVTLAAIIISVMVTSKLSIYYHILGTDVIGQDVFYQAVKSIRTGILMGTLTTLIMLPLAVTLGTMAGYFLGWVDDIIQYLYTTLSSIPGVLLIAAAVLMLQVFMQNHAELFTSSEMRADVRLLALCAILGITSWTGLCRLLRGEALKIRELEYIQAARVLGVKNRRIIFTHVFPNVLSIILITIAMDFSALVLAEAVLSYVGVGVDPTTQSFGNMINRARLELAREPAVWWSLCAAFTLMFILVLFANIFSDVVRDAFDPKTVKG